MHAETSSRRWRGPVAALAALLSATLVLSGGLAATAAADDTAESPAISARALSDGVTHGALDIEGASPAPRATARSAQAAASSLTGVVTDASATGVAGVVVSAYVAVPGAGDTLEYALVSSVETDASGVFQFGGLAAGDYDLFFDPIDRADLAWGWVDGAIAPAAVAPISLADEPIALEAPVVLAPAAEVEGSLTSERSGGGLTGATVTLWGSDGPDATGIAYFEPLLEVDTISGAFAFGGLPAGYYLAEFAAPTASYQGEWWDDAASFEESTILPLATGQTQRISGALSSKVNLGDVRITGASASGSTIKALHNVFSSTYTYRWFADGELVRGATSRTFRIPSSLEHKRMSVEVTGSKTGVVSTTVLSDERAQILRTATPDITGKTAIFTRGSSEDFWVGSRLTAHTGSWTAGTSFRYQWYANGKAISGATSYRYTLQPADKGKRITVRVTGSKDGYGTFSRLSAPTKKIALLGSVHVNDSPTVGQEFFLSWTFGRWTRYATLTYKYYADGQFIGSHREGERSPYIGSWLIGKRLQVKVSVARSGFTTHTVSSELSDPITR